MAESQEYSIMLVKDKNGNKHFVPDILETEKVKKKKERTTYCCYVCGNELSFHSGQHIRPYYQHKSGEKCDYSNESDIHKRYKEILSRPGQQFQVGDNIYTVKNAEVEKSFSVLESWIKTDLFVKTEEDKDFILEVAYWNKKKGYEVYEILKGYAEYKARYNMMDYDDLLYFTVKILEENEDIRKRMDERYQYIMVDEYQDTNVIQDKFLKLITKDYRNIAVVGDDNQSIYRFRGAHIENILEFKDRYPDCKDIVLVQNYRSTQEILDLSNLVMGHAVEGIPKELIGQKHGKRPDFIIANSQNEEAQKIISYIEDYHKQGIPYKDMSVLIRYGRSSYILEAELNKQRIPYKKFGGIKFVEKEHVRNILSYLRAGSSDKDMVAWIRILKLIPGIGPKAAKDFALDVAENGTQALNGLLYMNKSYYKELYILDDMFSEFQYLAPAQQIKYLVEKYYYTLKEKGINASRKKDRDKIDELEKLEKSKEDMELLMDMAKPYMNADEFLEDLVLNAADPDKEVDSVNITTIHSAKGLEYEVVFLMDPVQGMFPRTYDAEEPDNKEDLRCLYVALTRAKERLHIFLSSFYSSIQNGGELSMHLDHPDVLAACDYPKELGYFSSYVPTPKKWRY